MSAFQKNKSFKGGQGGYALLIGLIFFLAASSAVIAAISDAVFRETKTVRNETLSKQSYYSSESAVEDIAYRIKTGKSHDPTENYAIASSTVVVTTLTNASGAQEISAAADANGTKRSVRMTLNEGSGINFQYALQGGLGGIDLSGGAHITGDVYTTGSIRGCSTCNISGTAVAAGKSTSNLDVDNSTPAIPTQSITFGNSNGSQDLSQSFTVSTTLSITGLKLYVKKVGSPANATIRITTDNAGKPSSTVLASGTLSSSLVTTSYNWMDIILTANMTLTAGTTYWVVVDANSNASAYYMVGANSAYVNGQAKVGRYGNNSWNVTTPAGLDSYFQVYIGDNQEGITGDDQYNPIPVTSSYSYKATHVNATGDLYCQIGTTNNKACNTSRGDPSIEAFPIQDSTITEWKTEAAVNTTVGNVTVGAAGATIGPRKIEGNLTVASGGTLNVSGTIWVTGTVTINGGSLVQPSNATKSYAIISDSTVVLSGGGEILGNTGSHILLVSMSTADPAITLNGGANDTVVFTPYGGLYISGGANVKAASAEHITADGGANIIYDPDVSQVNITTGSSGTATFGIKSWKEIE